MPVGCRADLPRRQLPEGGSSGATDFIYWNKGAFDNSIVVTVYPIAGPGAADGLRYVVATVQVYRPLLQRDTRLRSVVDDAACPALPLLHDQVARSGLTGFMAMLIRPLVKSRARSGMERYLDMTKKVVEGG